MKKELAYCLGLAIVFVLPKICVAVAPITVEGNADIKIVQQATVIKVQDMSFGTITSTGLTAATVRLETSGKVTCPTGFICTGTAQAARFTVTAGKTTVNIACTQATLTDTTGKNVLTLKPICQNTMTLNSSGTGALNVGGTIEIAKQQAEGDYSTTNTGGKPFSVTVNF